MTIQGCVDYYTDIEYKGKGKWASEQNKLCTSLG